MNQNQQIFTLPLEERDRRWNNIRTTMEKRELSCLIVWGSYTVFRDLNGNLQYLIGISTEGYLLFPLEGEPTLYTFEGGIEPTCWVKDWREGHPMYSKVISERLRELHLEGTKIGAVGLSGYYGELGFPYTTYASLVKNSPQAKFVDATDIVEEARMVKSDAEIRCLELACEIGEKAIQAVVDTTRVGFKDYEIRATMMDTMFRNGGQPASMLLYCQGKEVVHGGQSGSYFEPPSSKELEPGDVILTEFASIYMGYQSQFNQPFSAGKPNKEWSDIFKVILESFNNGFNFLKPGITIGELDEAFLSPIKKAGYLYGTPPFHGLGLGLEMPMGNYPRQPNFQPDTSFMIKAGMVLSFEPHLSSLDKKKGMSFGSTVLVTETACRLLSRTWKPEFKIV
ncbi:M24 family metallopeptidase [Chloroflexota bacterium]